MFIAEEPSRMELFQKNVCSRVKHAKDPGRPEIQAMSANLVPPRKATIIANPALA